MPIPISGVAAYLSVERAGQNVTFALENLGGNILSVSGRPQLVAVGSVRFAGEMASGMGLIAWSFLGKSTHISWFSRCS